MSTKLPVILARSLAGVMLASVVSACAQGMSAHPTAASKPCLAPAEWYTFAGDQPRATPGTEVLAAMARRNVVLLGEQHDNADHHQWQMQTISALHLLRPQMVIGFESFPRRLQPVLDKWVAGELTVKQFLEQAEWEKVWSFAPELYLPLFQFARMNRIPMVALNVERTLTETITKQGWDAVPAAQKEGVSRPAQPSAAYRDFLFETYQHHPSVAGKETGAAHKDDAAFRYFVESQTTWDRAMAEALARSTAGGGAQRPLLVGIMGSWHVRNGYGVPHQLRDLGVDGISVLLPVDADQDCNGLKPGYADAVFTLPGLPLDKPPPPRLGVRLEVVDGGVRLLDVTAGSLAEKTGLKGGDHIVSIAGAPVTKMSSVIAAVRAQPAGTWLPIEVRRGTETLEYVIKFPLQK